MVADLHALLARRVRGQVREERPRPLSLWEKGWG
jgi:hypothetical protein